MAVEEIFYGLKNAVSRGENLNDAVQSFINAGYDKDEVNEALKRISPNVQPAQRAMLPTLPSRPVEKMPALPELPKFEENPAQPVQQPMQMQKQIQLPTLPPPMKPVQVQVQVQEKPKEFPTIISKPMPSREFQELPQVTVKKSKFSFKNVSNKTLLVSIGVVGVLIIILTVYLISLLAA